MHEENKFNQYDRVGRINKKNENLKKRRRKYISIIITILLTIIIIYLNPTFVFTKAKDSDESSMKSVKGRVLRIISTEARETGISNQNIIKQSTNKESKMITQKVEVLITSGKHKSEEILVENNYDESLPYSFAVKKGDNLLLSIEENDQGKIIAGYVYEFGRDKYLIYIILIFVIAMVLVGGKKGIKSLITLIFTGIGVIIILPKLLLNGYNPILTSLLISIIIIILTLTIVSGINKKTIAAIIGTTGGVLIAGIIALVIGNMSNLTGLGSEEAQMLMYIPQNVDFNYKGLLFAGIIMGALGAVMDVSMSIASSMNEINIANPNISTRKLMKAGMSVGRDIMGTMSNTLILAYIGASLQLVILLMAWNVSLIEIVNRDIMASEIVRAMAGSIGLIFSIPITTVAAGLLKKDNKIA